MATAENKRPRGRPPAFDRAAVVKEAMLVFWANGYEGTSIPALTDAMGISAQSLYAAFGSKDALYREAIDLYLQTNGAYLANALAEEVDPVRAVAQILREAALAVTHQAAGGCMVTTAPSGFDDNDLAKFGRSLRAQGVTAMAKHFTSGVKAGYLKPGTDCLTWARYVSGCLYGLSVHARDGTSRAALLKVAEVAAKSFEALRP